MLVRSVIRFMLGFAVAYGALRVTVLRVWRVPLDDPMLSGSLAPTLWPGDWVVLWRGTPPTAGALVVCPDPADPEETVAARWVASGGESVEITAQGALRLNERKVPTEGSCPTRRFSMADPTTDADVELSCSVERLARTRYATATLPGVGLQPLGATRIVPEGHGYLVSDNRHAPFDSREFGPVPLGYCAEAVRLRLASPGLPVGMGPAFRWIQ